jgi:hypothetical protein
MHMLKNKHAKKNTYAIWITTELPPGKGSRFLSPLNRTFPKFWYSSGVSVGSEDGDLGDYFSPSSLIKFAMELNSGFGLNENHSSRPLMLNLTSPVLTLIWAFAMLRKGHPRMSDTFESGCMSNTTKLTGTKNSLILTGISLAIPTG